MGRRPELDRARGDNLGTALPEGELQVGGEDGVLPSPQLQALVHSSSPGGLKLGRTLDEMPHCIFTGVVSRPDGYVLNQQ